MWKKAGLYSFCKSNVHPKSDSYKTRLYSICRNREMLSQVEYIDFSNMSLEEFPEVVFFMPILRHLNLSENKLNTISDNIDSQLDLEYLDISHNRIERLPMSINKLKLKQLHLHNNRLPGNPTYISPNHR